MPTAAARDGIGIIDSKSSTHQTVYVVNLAAVDVTQAHLIHKHFEVALRDDGITILLFIKGHAILETGAPATGDEDAKPEAGIIFLCQQFAYFIGCSRGDGK